MASAFANAVMQLPFFTLYHNTFIAHESPYFALIRDASATTVDHVPKFRATLAKHWPAAPTSLDALHSAARLFVLNMTAPLPTGRRGTVTHSGTKLMDCVENPFGLLCLRSLYVSEIVSHMMDNADAYLESAKKREIDIDSDINERADKWDKLVHFLWDVHGGGGLDACADAVKALLEASSGAPLDELLKTLKDAVEALPTQ